MSKISQLLLALLLFAVGIALFFVHTDREYINLIPTEGTTNGTILRSDTSYQQTFPARRQNIACVGLYLRPATRFLPSDQVTVTLLNSHRQPIADNHIPTSFIDSQGVSRVCFDPPVATTLNEPITIAVSVPPTLDGHLRLQQRVLDSSFNPATVSFTVNETSQPEPAAYFVSADSRPTLALQLGGLFVLTAILLCTPAFKWWRYFIYSLGTALLFVVPRLNAGQSFPIVVFVWAVIASAGMILLLRHLKLDLLPTLFAAQLFAFTTWFPLHALAGREHYLVVACLPLALAWLFGFSRFSLHTRHTWFLITIVAALTLLFFTHWAPVALEPYVVAHPRDVFVDPYQVPSSDKFGNEAASWDHFGSYIGFVPAILAVIGVIGSGRRYWPVVILGILGAFIALTPALTLRLAPASLVPPQHAVIVTTFALSFFAGWGLKLVTDWLGRDVAVRIVTIAIVVLILLDLFQVAAHTLEFIPL